MVGVQPFGGNGLSGTGPKAGGPLYVRRLCTGWDDDTIANAAAPVRHAGRAADPLLRAADAFATWLRRAGHIAEAEAVERTAAQALGPPVELPGPVGERNVYRLKPRGAVLARVQTETGLRAALAPRLPRATASSLTRPQPALDAIGKLPREVAARVRMRAQDPSAGDAAIQAVLFEGDSDALRALNEEVAGWPGGVVPVYGVSRSGLAEGHERFPVAWLSEEVVVSTNTAAAGGNASLMTIG